MDQQGHAINLYRLEGYNDRLARRSRDTSRMRAAELEAYEEGIANAERDTLKAAFLAGPAKKE